METALKFAVARNLHFECALHKHTYHSSMGAAGVCCANHAICLRRDRENRPGENMRTASKTTLTTMGLALAALGPTLAWAADAPPVPNKGDTAWMLTSTALVLLMSVPALALFYG